MKSTPLFILLGLLALTAVAATAFLGRTATHPPPTGLGIKAVEHLDAQKIFTIRLKQGDRQIELQRAPGGYWELPALGGFPASDRVDSLMETLAQLRVDDRLTARVEDLASYHLTPEQAMHLAVFDRDHQPVVELLIGCTGPNQRGGYFRHANATELLLTFDSRISQLPLTIQPWTRLQMGLIPPTGMAIELTAPGIDPIQLVQQADAWRLLTVKTNAQGQALEDPDPDKLRQLAAMASNLLCDGVFPPETAVDGLGFAPGGPVLILNDAKRTIGARVEYGSPRVLPGLVAADGRPASGPVVPMRIQFQFARDAAQDPYETWFNRKTAERLFWIRQAGFDSMFVAHDQLTMPKPPDLPGVKQP